MGVIYYQFYLLYQRIHRRFPFVNNRLEATWAIGISQGFMFTGILNFLLVKYRNLCLDKNLLFALAIVIVLLNVLYFDFYKNGSRAIKKKSLFLGSKKASIVITVLFFLTCTITYLISAIKVKNYFDLRGGSIEYFSLIEDVLHI
jgi:hypothetical protein